MLKKLRHALNRPDAVILVGSGASVWSGLPTWSALIELLAKYLDECGLNSGPVREEIKNGDLLLAAGYGLHQLELPEFSRFLRGIFNEAKPRPSELHHLIAALGPTCFVTTNYDRLLESALEDKSSHEKPLVVTNRQPTEIATIITASARNFLFKYHGDIEQIESVVLSREQYRNIIQDFPTTGRALSTLLATRPVIMIGFGLRDPDFLSIQDELVSVFRGQAGEYFAIMPDFDDLRLEYWRRHYRVNIISYKTTTSSDGKRDHGALLEILRALQPGSAIAEEISQAQSPSASDRLFSLARLGASMSRLQPHSGDTVLPLTASAEPSIRDSFRHFHHGLVEDLLQKERGSFSLLGLPGAGKSFSLKMYVANLGRELTQQCLSEKVDPTRLHIPILVNLALYDGDLRALLQSNLPSGLTLDDVLGAEACTAVLDSANEMPRSFIENGKWLDQLKELRSDFPNCRFVVGSRNETWTETLDLPRFTIGDIEKEFVAKSLSAAGLGHMLGNEELLAVLRKPLLFSLARDGSVDVTGIRTPVDMFRALFEATHSAWKSTGAPDIDFAETLQSVAYEMMQSGVEHATKEQFEAALAEQTSDPDRALSFLLKRRLLVALPGRRLSFFHQSMTEYLAARVVAANFLQNPESLVGLLKDKRWDQSLFLSLGILPATSVSEFLGQVLDADVSAAARAAYFVEFNQAAITSIILERTLTLDPDFDTGRQLEDSLWRLSVGEQHTSQLEKLAMKGDSLGGLAAAFLFLISPQNRKGTITLVLSRSDDFNFVGNFVRRTKGNWTYEEIRFLFEEIEEADDNSDGASNLGDLLKDLSEIELVKFLEEYSDRSEFYKKIIGSGLGEIDSDIATSLLISYVKSGYQFAIVYLYFNLIFTREDYSGPLTNADEELASSIIQALSSDVAHWAVGLGRALIMKDPMWSEVLSRWTPLISAGDRLILDLMLASGDQVEGVIKRGLEVLPSLSSAQIEALGGDGFWRKAPSDFVLQAIKTRHPEFVLRVLEACQFRKKEIELLQDTTLDDWLAWTDFLTNEETVWCSYMLRDFIANGSNNTREALLHHLNSGQPDVFWRIAPRILPLSNTISTDELSDAAIDHLLNRANSNEWIGKFFGKAATEDFVNQILLPTWRQQPDKHWVRVALEAAGRRHNRRYLIES